MELIKAPYNKPEQPNKLDTLHQRSQRFKLYPTNQDLIPACQRLRPARQSPEASRWRTGAADGGQAPGLLQHIMARGIERSDIFRDDKDRKSFVDRLAIIFEETLKDRSQKSEVRSQKSEIGN